MNQACSLPGRRDKGELSLLKSWAAAFLLTFVAALGPKPLCQAQPSIFEMAHKSWKVQDGAPPNISELVRGPDGLLWITTDAGLFRFDGLSFTKYVPAAGNALISDHLWTICAAPDGSIWVSYAFGGVSRIQGGTVKNFSSQQGLSAGQIRQIAFTAGGVVWLSGTGGLFTVIDSVVRKVGLEAGLPPGGIACFAQDAKKNLWVSLGEYEYSLPTGRTHFEAAGRIPGHFVDSCMGESGNRVSLQIDGVRHYSFQLAGARFLRTELRVPKCVLQLWTQKDGSVWMVTSDRGVLYAPYGWSGEGISLKGIQQFDRQAGLSSNFPGYIHADDEGSVWVPTRAGLDQFRPYLFRSDMLDTIAAVAIAGGGGSPVYVGSNNLSVIRDGVLTHLTSTIGERGFRSLYVSRDGSIWGGTEKSLRHFERGSLSTIHEPPEARDNWRGIQTITEDARHGLWISVIRHGVFRFDGHQWIRSGGYVDLPVEPAVSFGNDESGGIWFGYLDGRVANISSTGTLHMYASEDGPGIGAVKVFTPHDKALLLGGDSGISAFMNGHFRPVRLRDGKELSGITGIVFDDAGDLWASGSSWITRIPHGELERALKQTGYLVAFEKFDSHDGLEELPSPMAGLGSARTSSDGYLYFTSFARVNWIKPSAIQRNKFVPPVTIDEIRADDQTFHWPTGSLRTRANPKALQILFTAGSLLVPERVRFRYRLEGYDRDWIEAGGRREAFYAKLPPGHYIFRVLAANDAGVWNNVGAAVTLVIPPTLTQTMLFRIAVLLVTIGIVALFFKLRIEATRRALTRQMYGVLAERQRIARDLHDTFLQSVQAMVFKFAIAVRQIPEHTAVRTTLDEVVDQSDQVLIEGRQLINDLRTEERPVSELFAMLKEAVSPLQSLRPTTAFLTEVTEPQQCLSADLGREVLGLAKEALANAFRHANAEHVWLKVDAGTRALVVQISDDGCGIDPMISAKGHRDGHWGIQNMRERADRIGGRLAIRNNGGIGTTVELTVPAHIAFPKASHPWHSRLFSAIGRMLRVSNS